MPEGMRCSTVFLPAMTSVCPALCPPWKRTTPCARSVSQSTILPLPSSPHCVPITTTLRALIAPRPPGFAEDRKSTRLNSSHGYISYAVFCLKKKKKKHHHSDHNPAEHLRQ